MIERKDLQWNSRYRVTCRYMQRDLGGLFLRFWPAELMLSKRHRMWLVRRRSFHDAGVHRGYRLRQKRRHGSARGIESGTSIC